MKNPTYLEQTNKLNVRSRNNLLQFFLGIYEQENPRFQTKLRSSKRSNQKELFSTVIRRESNQTTKQAPDFALCIKPSRRSRSRKFTWSWRIGTSGAIDVTYSLCLLWWCNVMETRIRRRQTLVDEKPPARGRFREPWMPRVIEW
jgi:hypothetical protein